MAGLSNLAQRVITAVVLLAALLGLLFAAPIGITALVFVSMLMVAGWEWAGFMGRGHSVGFYLKVSYIILIFMAFASVMYAVEHGWVPLDSVMWVSLTWWAVAVLILVLYPVRIPASAVACIGPLVLIPAWVGAVSLLFVGPWQILYLLGMVWAADIGAYFTGKSLGRHKLAPSVSPGKTREGMAGGVVAAAAVALGGAGSVGLGYGEAAVLGLLVAVISVVGDLTVSVFKREADLKDSGSLFPGHGGVLDRVDSLMAALPLFVVALLTLGRIQPF